MQLGCVMYYDTVCDLPDDFLVNMDRASTAVSLEVRASFSTIGWLSSRGGCLSDEGRRAQGKWALRQVLYRYVPKDLADRPKKGSDVALDAFVARCGMGGKLVASITTGQRGLFVSAANPRSLVRAPEQPSMAGAERWLAQITTKPREHALARPLTISA
jgi:Asparagine synthase